MNISFNRRFVKFNAYIFFVYKKTLQDSMIKIRVEIKILR